MVAGRTMTFQELAAKKVLGVPVLYLAAGFVTILAIVAWRMKSTSDTDTSGIDAANSVAGADQTSENDSAAVLAGMEADGSYSGYVTNGTVVVQPTPSTATETTPAIADNGAWVKAGAEWLVAQKKASGTEAVSALSKYVDGNDLSFDEGALVNLAIQEKGQPPESLGKIGIVNTAPAQKQFNNYPGTHTVKGANDNTPAKLAALYYGNSDALHSNKIAASNLALGPVGTTYNVGTKVAIPAYANPRYAIVDAKHIWPGQLASANGLSYTQFLALNPGLIAPYKVGSKVRVF
jgi:hypothetical protein